MGNIACAQPRYDAKKYYSKELYSIEQLFNKILGMGGVRTRKFIQVSGMLEWYPDNPRFAENLYIWMCTQNQAAIQAALKAKKSADESINFDNLLDLTTWLVCCETILRKPLSVKYETDQIDSFTRFGYLTKIELVCQICLNIPLLKFEEFKASYGDLLECMEILLS
jgi:hypothetical protein